MITSDHVRLTQEYINDNNGILNALSKASAQYIYKVIEKHTTSKRFVNSKQLHRTIVHKNCHLDEYFAELLFRSILPPYQKDLEIKEHTLISKKNDTFAKMSWPNAVVFGIGAVDAGGATALQIFDEHSSDGTRVKLSCSQLVADEFLPKIPRSIQIVLDEVNRSDAYRGAHQYNLKNIITTMHGTLFAVHYDEVNKTRIFKYLTENWKRAIVDVCLAAMIYAYENSIYSEPSKSQNLRLKTEIEKSTWRQLNYFITNTLLRSDENFDVVKKTLIYHFKVDNHTTIDNAIWKDSEDHEISKQILIIHLISYAIEKCWGERICRFVMMHIWQCIFQQQILFSEITHKIIDLPNETVVNTRFGSIKRIFVKSSFLPEKRPEDRRIRNFNSDAPLWIYDVSVTKPGYHNVATALKAVINGNYEQKGNNGFGLFLLHDKTINAKMINTGSTIPRNIWEKISDAITNAESDRWFQLKDASDAYADFIINRNSAHQEHLPTNKIDSDFLINIVKSL
jgi:hypothetical protein